MLLHLYQILRHWDNTIGYGDIVFTRFWGYRKCRHECSLGVNLVIEIVECRFGYLISYQILKQLDNITYGDITFGGYIMSFGCERSCSKARKVSNFNDNVHHGGGYLPSLI